MTSAKAEWPVLRGDKVIYSVALMKDHLNEKNHAKDQEEEFEAMEVEVAGVVAEETLNRLEKGKSEVI